MYTWLQEAIAGGAEIVTVNKRLARELQHAHEGAQLARGLRSWPTPRILPWTVWLNSLLDRCVTSERVPLRLHPQAAAVIWERLLRQHAGDRILAPDSLVRQAQQAWQRIHDWNVQVAELRRYANTDDEQLFAIIATDFQRQLDSRPWIDHAQLGQLVTELVEQGKIEAPPKVVYAGFDRLVPAALRLFLALTNRGATVEEAVRIERNARVHVVCCASGDAELRAAGLWARRLVDGNTGARIAIVCPRLEQNAPRAARLIREGLMPGWQYAGVEGETTVNVSYGRRLAEYPLIRIALLWLSWTGRGLPTRDVSMLLRTPFAGLSMTDGRCRLEMELRRLPDRNWRPASLAVALRGRDQSPESVDWLQRVELVAAMESARETPESPSVWASRIDQLLHELGWPGERPLDTSEFQLVNRWRELLNELSRLDIVQPRIDLAEAVSRLAFFAAETIYQPETEPGTVQLLGTLEAAGLAFDHVWVCHLDAEQWPPTAHPSPLLSRTMQRKFGMPDATPADTLEFARLVLQRLAGCGTDVVLSWPATEQDLELEASPLLSPYSGADPVQVEDPGWFAATLADRNAVGRAREDPAPAIRPGEKVIGGSATVQRQAADPFSAFAYGRLGVKDLQTIEPGLSASTRGNIIHRALHHLLQDKPSSRDIAAWAEDLDDRIEGAVDAALARQLRFADGVLLRLLAIERRRLRVILRKFLEAETRRQEFRVVSVEESIRYSRYGVELDLRADRIDRLPDGALLIVDYKTGAVKSLLSRDGEPKELQLIVYASAVQDPVGGIVLINVDSRDIVYRGAGGNVEWDRLPPELWEQRLGRWKRTVDQALASLAAGDLRLNTALAAADSRPLNVLSRAEELKRGR